MKHKSLIVLMFLFFASLHATGSSIVYGQPPLFSQNDVQRYGLTRSWYNQVPIGSLADGIAHVLLHQGTLFIVTQKASVYAYDAESGKQLWHRLLSEQKWDTLSPAANNKTFAVINGAEVSVLDRRNGRLLWHALLPDNAAAGCVMSDHFLFVPLITGKVMCYRQEELVYQDEMLTDLVAAFKTVGYTLNPVTGKIIQSHEMEGVEKPQQSQDYADLARTIGDEALAKLVEEYAKLGYKPSSLAGKLFEPTTAELEKVDNAYFMKPIDDVPLSCISFGSTTIQPILANIANENENVAWITDLGQLFIAKARVANTGNSFLLEYRLNVNPEILFRSASKLHRVKGNVANDVLHQPTHAQRDPDPELLRDDPAKRSLILVGTQSGYVVAYNETSGEIVWVYSTGVPISGRIAAFGSHLTKKGKLFDEFARNIYIPCMNGTLVCLNKETGIPQWTSPKIDSFIAASPHRLYFKNTRNELVGINPVDGAQTRLFKIDSRLQAYLNLENDRIYFVTKSGLIQCLHETTLEEQQTYLLPLDKFKIEDNQKHNVSVTTGQYTLTPQRPEQPVQDDEFDEFGGGLGFGMEAPEPPRMPQGGSIPQGPPLPTPQIQNRQPVQTTPEVIEDDLFSF